MDSRDLKLVLKLQDEASAELRAFGVGVVDVEKKTENLGLRIGNTEVSFKKMAAVGSAAFLALSYTGVQAVSAYDSFNQEIERAGAFVNATADEMDLFRQASIEAARGTQFSFEQAAAALGNFVGGEIDATTASAELGGVIDLAIVAKMQDLQQAVNLGSLALTVFKDDAMEMSDVTDILATVASDVTTETDKWANAIVNSSGAAKAAGFSFKDLNVLFATMVRGGADANLMWSAFNSAITRLQAPSKQTIEALSGVGIKVTDMQKAMESGPIEMLELLRKGFDEANKSGQGFGFLANVIGSQAAPEFALALGLTNEELAETAGYFEDIEGRGGQMVDRLKGAVPVSLQLKSAMSELNIALGGAFKGAVDGVGRAILPLVQNLTKWINENPKLTRTIFIIATAIAGLLAVVGTLGIIIPAIVTGFAALGTILSVVGGALALLLSPIGLVVAAAVAAAVLIVKNWEAIKEFFIGLGQTIADVFTTAWQWVTNITAQFWEGLKNTFWDSINFIVGLFATLLDLIFPGWEQTLTAILERGIEIWTAIKEFFINIFLEIGEVFSTWFTGLQERWTTFWTGLKDIFTGIWEAIAAVFDGVIDGIKSGMETLIAPIQRVIDLAERALALAGGAISNVRGKISNAVQSVIGRGSQITGRAIGGPVNGGTPYIVGENGPEMFVPGGYGRIVPNGSMGGGGGGVVVNVYGDVSGQELVTKVTDALAMQIKRRMRI